MKYIDAEKLKAEIKRQIKSSESCPFIEAEFGAEERREGKIRGYKEILFLIDSLQQEQPEVDFEEEIATWIPSHITGGEEGVWKECRETVTKWAGIVARHFYELGKNSK